MNQARKIIIAAESGIAIRTLRDITDAISACFGSEVAGLLLTEEDLSAEFFDLRTGLAGEMFQKFTNYRKPIALVLPNSQAYGLRFSELAHEHATHNLIRFVRSKEDGIIWLSTVVPQ